MHPRLSRRSLIATTSGLALAPSLASSLAAAQGTPVATPAVSRPDDLLVAAVDHGVPGIALAIARGGEPVYSGAAGVASVEDGAPLQPTDRFRIYSITKTFVATVVLQLADEQVLTLDDTVTDWLDDPAVTAIPNVDTATVRQLLTHTSGIYDVLDSADSPFYEDAWLGPNADWTKVWTLPELLAYAAADRHDPYFAPGAGVHYSNTAYLLLGMIVEQATGNTFDDELRTRILEPLALKDTSLEMGATLPDDVVDAYHLINGELVNVSVINLTWSWTEGGIVSTTSDLMRFAEAVFSGELLSPAAFDAMFTITPTPDMGGGGWGMGVYRVPSPVGELTGNEGGAAGGTSYMLRPVDSDITVVVLANWAPDDGTVQAVAQGAVAWALAHPDG
jgi:D-alanyl-D-alanine carboxypeptidase